MEIRRYKKRLGKMIHAKSWEALLAITWEKGDDFIISSQYWKLIRLYNRKTGNNWFNLSKR